MSNQSESLESVVIGDGVVVKGTVAAVIAIRSEHREKR